MKQTRCDMNGVLTVCICACALIILAMSPPPALANAIPDTGSVDDGKVQYDYNFDMAGGGATIAISNIGTTPLDLFQLDIAELIEYWPDPDVWQLTPPSGTGTFSITGGSLANGESFLIDYEFNKDLVQLVYSDLIYSGIGDNQVHLSGIVTTALIPEPSTLAALTVAIPLLLRRRRHRRARP